MKLVTGDQCDEAQRLDDERYGYPSEGVPVGKGRHWPLPDTPGPGWNIHNRPIKVDDKDRRTYEIGLALAEEIANAKSAVASDPKGASGRQKKLAKLDPVDEDEDEDGDGEERSMSRRRDG